ncbi:amino acid adenylation domain-containing protein [Enterobacter hormaechei]|nr:amino acid adenylation domain-containing protein [Enterobacter hormaechei]
MLGSRHVSDKGIYPATPIQRAYFVGRQSCLPLGGIECVGYMEFSGRHLDEGRLRNAIGHVSRHPALRMRFINSHSLAESEITAPELKVHYQPSDCETDHNIAVKERMMKETVNLTEGNLWGAELTRWQNGEATLHIAISLAAVDLQGLSSLMLHLARAYSGAEPSFGCCTASQLYSLLQESHDRTERQRRRKKIKNKPERDKDNILPPPDLPFTSLGPVPADNPDKVIRHSKFYSSQDWEKIKIYAAKIGVAQSALVLALYSRALRLCSTTQDFLITVTHLSTAGTETELAERTLTYGHRARAAASLPELAKSTHDDLHYRLRRGVDCDTEIRRALEDPDVYHPGLSPYIFTFSAQKPVFDRSVIQTFGRPRMWGQTPQTIIDCQVFMLTDEETEVSFDVRRGAVPADIDTTVFMLLTESIDDIISGREPDSVLPDACRMWRKEVNSTPAASAPEMLFSGFRRQVLMRPQATAIVSPAADPDLPSEFVDPLSCIHQIRKWSYAELDQLALRMAARLAVHSAPGDIVGIRLPKGPAQIVAVLGVLYAGCVYLPVGLDMPEERLDKIRQRSSMQYLLTESDFERLELQEPLLAPLTQTAVSNPEALAYVIFTSGSTGEPKGVAISHRAAVNTVVDVNTRHQVTENDVLLAVSSLDFDLSVYDIFGPLSAGATIVTINESERRDAFRWAERINVHQITLWNSVPALASMLSSATDSLPSVRLWLCSGDWIAPSLFSELQKVAPNSVLVAMGGSTEAAIWSNEYVIRSADDLKPHWPSVPYGLPLSGQQYRVVREYAAGRFEDCPDGVTGELWIGGEGLAQGYLGDHERTAERFVSVEVAPETGMSRWYRTGDLGYWREGLLFFVGRLDTQVKIQGHRVECGEIEQVLKSLPGVEHAVVVPIRQRRALGAILTGHNIVPDQMRQLLSRQLPHYMLPARFLVRDRLALSRNGKIDRAWANQELESEEPLSHRDTAPATSATFSACLAIWRQVLKRDDICAGDNFFALGGDSLGATRVCALLQSKGIQVGVGELFAASTLNAFVLRCHPSAAYHVSGDIIEEPQDPFPLTSLQQAYALGADGIPGVSRCDTVFSAIISNVQNHPLAHWQQSLDVLIRETAALRVVRNESQQRVIGECPVQSVELPAGEDLQCYLSEAPLDAETCPPVRLVVVEGDVSRVGLMFNYLSLDALSLIRIILALVNRVTGVKEGYQPESHITPFLHYVGQSASLRTAPSEWDAEIWLPPSLTAASSMPDVSSVKSITWHLSGAVRHGLEVQAQREQATLSALIFQALGESLITLCERQKIVVVVPVCNRPQGSPQALGQFTQLRLCRYAADTAVTEVSRELGEAVAGRTPDDRYIATRGRAVYPFVFTSTVGIPEVETLNQRETRIVWSHTRTPGVLIDCQVIPCGDGLEIRWDYASDVLEHSQLMVAHRVFISKLMREQEAEKAAAMSVFSSEPPVAELNGHEIATRAITAALGHTDEVPDPFSSIIDAWKKQVVPVADPAWLGAGRFLAACITGKRPRNDLLSHPFLSPEQLLVSSLKNISFFDNLIADLRKDFLLLNPVRSALRVLILGAGSGVFGKTLIVAADENGLPLLLEEYETNDALNTLARRRNNTINIIPDVVIAPASLHRDEEFLGRLTDLCRREHRDIPVRIHVLEVAEPDAASLIAALFDPAIVDNEQTPLMTSSAWGQRLEQAGARVDQIQQPEGNLIWIKATLPLSHFPEAQLKASGYKLSSAKIEELVADSWKTVLGLNASPAPTADFFALGGDSLGATQIVMALRRKGIEGVRLADLFNYPTFSDFSAKIVTQCNSARKQASDTDLQAKFYPLTPLQKAYLAGRSMDQLLGGVASHCYFEFSVTDSERIDITRLQQALSVVVARHDALRSRIVWQNSEPFGQVSQQIVCLPEVSTDVRALTEAENPDPVRDYPLRVRLSEDGKTIGIGMDNLMLDGMSMFLVMRELGAVYQGEKLSPPPAMTYAQYRHSRRNIAPTTTVTKRMPPAPRLPWLSSLAAADEMRFSRCAHDIDVNQWLTLRQLASGHRVTPAALLLAAYALEVAEIASNTEFSLNVTTFERDPGVSDVTSLVGDFTQLGLVAFAPVSGARSPEQRSQSLLEQAQVAHQGLLIIHDRPEQVSTLRIAREIVRQQGDPVAGLFPVVFTSGLGLDKGTHRSDEFGFGTMTYARSQTPQVAMDFQVHDDIRGLHITVDYVTTLLAAERVGALTRGVADRLQELITFSPTPEREATVLAATIARIWCKYLPEAGEETPDNFFQAGGDSLQATRCIRALQKEIDQRITLRLLLVYPRFSDFCEQVAQLIQKKDTGKATAATEMSDYDEGML